MQNNHSLKAQFEKVLGIVKYGGQAVVIGRRPLSNNDGMTLYFRPREGYDTLRIVVDVPAKNGDTNVSDVAWSVLAQGVGLFYKRLRERDAKRTNYLYCPLCQNSSPLALRCTLHLYPDIGNQLVLEELVCGKYPLYGADVWGLGLIRREPCEFEVNMNHFAYLHFNTALLEREFMPIAEFTHIGELAEKLMFWHDFLMAVKRLAVIDYWSKP